MLPLSGFAGTARQLTRPWVLVAVGVLTAATIAAAVWVAPGGTVPWALVAGCVVADTVAAYAFPIHIHQNTKVCLTSVPMFLAAVLLPGPVAVVTMAVAVFLGEVLVSQERGNRPTDAFLAALRWLVVGLLTSPVAHWPTPGSGLMDILRLSGTAGLMFLADSLFSALHIAALTGESVAQVLNVLRREAALFEGIQYMLGVLGALAARESLAAPALLILPLAIAYIIFKSTKELQDSTRQLLESMADAVDLRDAYTGGHSRRVSELCAGLLHTYHSSGPEADLIIAAARVHDIGKIGMPDTLLRKAGPLTPDEREQMQAHAALGAALLQRHRNFTRGAAMVRHHHERWDGHGYPDGLAGPAIPYGARLIAIADSYDAMTSTRPYRAALTPAQAVYLLRHGRGTQWDPAIVDAFIDSLARPAENSDQLLPETGVPAA